MTLSARLDRLRGAPKVTDGSDVGERLRRLRQVTPVPTACEVGDQELLDALHAQGRDGVLFVDRHVDLPVQRRPQPGDLPETCALAEADWVYLDTETTGLSGGVGNLAFMVGLARYDPDGTLWMRQLLISRFAAEAAMLSAMTEWIGRHAVVVTYNGKCFDIPLLQSRMRLHRVEHAFRVSHHLDLMFSVRRAFRHHWPDCRLQTAERRLLDIVRSDDLPGAEAPAAWRGWLRVRDTSPLAGVLRHNFQDVVSLALLHRYLVGIYNGSETTRIDHAATGAAWRNAGDEVRARRVWERAGEHLDEGGWLLLAASYRRAGDWRRAEAVWLQLFGRGNRVAAAELSKYYEHRRRDLQRAFRFASYCEPLERTKRLTRLQRKLGDGPQMPLWPQPSVGECDQVAGAVGDRQATGKPAGTACIQQPTPQG